MKQLNQGFQQFPGMQLSFQFIFNQVMGSGETEGFYFGIIQLKGFLFAGYIFQKYCSIRQFLFVIHYGPDTVPGKPVHSHPVVFIVNPGRAEFFPDFFQPFETHFHEFQHFSFTLFFYVRLQFCKTAKTGKSGVAATGTTGYQPPFQGPGPICPESVFLDNMQTTDR